MKRDRVFERDDFRCVYCGKRFAAGELSVDHVEPRVRGGDQSTGNLVTACRGCNNLKGHRRVSEFLRDDVVARENFLKYAVHLWPRLRRTLIEELDADGSG
ncbi:MAG TPA: HNH endonuclease [Gemmatimonadaceae bacterium]|nr:HNH endonuclease [Gemmatimonadaceae bacterium]